MDKKILSTKNTNKLNIFAAIIFDIFSNIAMWCVSLCFLMKGGTANHCIYFFVLIIILISLSIYSFISVLKSIYFLFSYMDVYDGYIKGVSKQGRKLMNFKIENKDIINVIVNNIHITVYTGEGIFEIITNEKTAKKINEYFLLHL